ncbi:hypothetical protein Taro_002115 [Colocasia esculenta]|uniref:DUF1985 domain-containing protein n=1 Tax=Colocasia esculenta TaxID=4460 RepID=A0A843THU6_COLES|nr:hypothetical protein [Colocasia esculenta]
MKDKEQIKFRECHKELMRATPFAPYVDIPPMKCFGISLLEEIIAHHEEGNVFNIGNKSLSFTVEDVALILGMPCTGYLVHHYGSSIEVSKLHKRFGKDTAFTRQVIHGYLIDLVGSVEKEDIKDTVWLWILLLLSTFLAPRSSYVCSPQMIKYLDDIERIRSYAWAVAFHELILHNIEEASKMVESKLPIHPIEQWLLEGQRGNTNSGDFAPAKVNKQPHWKKSAYDSEMTSNKYSY